MSLVYYDGEAVAVVEWTHGSDSVEVSRHKEGVLVDSFIVDGVRGGVVDMKAHGNATALHHYGGLTLLVGHTVVAQKVNVRCFDVGDTFVVCWCPPTLVRLNFDGHVAWEVNGAGIRPTSIFVRGDHVYVTCDIYLSKHRIIDGSIVWARAMPHVVADVNDIDDVVFRNHTTCVTSARNLFTTPTYTHIDTTRFGITLRGFVTNNVLGIMTNIYYMFMFTPTHTCTIQYIRLNSGRKTTREVLFASNFNRHGIYGLIYDKYAAIDHCILEESALTTVGSAPWKAFWEKDGDHAIWSRVLSFELE